MKKLFLFFLLAMTAFSTSTAMQSISDLIKKKPFLAKLLYNPAYEYEYTLPSGNTLILDLQKILLLANATSYNPPRNYSAFQNPWSSYSTVVDYGIIAPSALFMIFRDWKIGCVHIIALLVAVELALTADPEYGSNIVSVLLYALQSFYTDKWIPWTYRTNQNLLADNNS